MKHKRGDTFDFIVLLPESVVGDFVGYVPTCQIRDMQDVLISDVVTDWVDPDTAAAVSLQVAETQAWPIGPAVFDIQFRRESDQNTISTWPKVLHIVADVTRP